MIDDLWSDSIIEEVRKAGVELAEECDYDVHKFSEMLSRNEKIREQEGWKMIGKEELDKVATSSKNNI